MGSFKKSRTVTPKLLVDSDRLTEIMSITDVDAQSIDPLPAAAMKGGIVVHTSATSGGEVKFDTATNIIAGIPLTENGQVVKCYYINDGDEDLTFAVNTGTTISDVGQLCLQDEGVLLLVRRVSATAVKVYILGGDAAGD